MQITLSLHVVIRGFPKDNTSIDVILVLRLRHGLWLRLDFVPATW